MKPLWFAFAIFFLCSCRQYDTTNKFDVKELVGDWQTVNKYPNVLER